MEFSSNLTLEIFNQPFILEKRIELLKAIEKEGSINKAAKSVPMSYKAAWEAVDMMNNLSPRPIVIKATGGKNGGGTELTDYGRDLINSYTLLKREQEKFLNSMSRLVDGGEFNINAIRRLSMQISARNQISGVVEHIDHGKVNAQLYIKLKSGYTIISVVTDNAVESMAIKVGDEVVAIFKSSSVILSTDNAVGVSSRNKIKGIISNISTGEINTEVTVDIGGDRITSIITKNAAEELGLKTGDEVTALIKSSDVMVGK